MELSIQERLKDLRVERGLTLEQLAEQTHLSKSALGSYEAEDFKDISHYAIIKLAKFYGVTADYLLGLSQTKNHPNADLADLHLSDDMIELLKSERVDNSLLCELAAHPDFPRLMADLEIYVNGIAGKQVQSANAIVDAVSTTIMKQHNPGFCSFVVTLRRYIYADALGNQLDLLCLLFGSFLQSTDAEDFTFDNGQVCRWLNGTARVSPKITSFYLVGENQEKLTQDMETKILTIMSDPAMAAQSECDLLMQDVSISTSKKKSLYAERDFSVSAQVAEFLSLIHI